MPRHPKKPSPRPTKASGPSAAAHNKSLKRLAGLGLLPSAGQAKAFELLKARVEAFEHLATLRPRGEAITEEEARAMGHLVTVVPAGPPMNLPPPTDDQIDQRYELAREAVTWIEKSGKDFPEVAEEAVRKLVALADVVVDALERIREANPEAIRAVAEVKTNWPVMLPALPSAAKEVANTVLSIGLAAEAANIKTKGRGNRWDPHTPSNKLVLRIVRELRGVVRGKPPKKDPDSYLPRVIDTAAIEFRRVTVGCDRQDMAAFRQRVESAAREGNPGDAWSKAERMIRKAFGQIYGPGLRQ